MTEHLRRAAGRSPPAQRDGDHLHCRLRLLRSSERQFLRPRECRQHRQAGVVHRRDRRRHDLRPAHGRHRPLGRVEHVSVGNGRRLFPANPGHAERFRGRRCDHRRPLRRGDFRRRQRVLHRGAAHNAVPGDAGDPGRRARSRHGHHRILWHQLHQGLRQLRRMVARPRARNIGWFVFRHGLPDISRR